MIIFCCFSVKKEETFDKLFNSGGINLYIRYNKNYPCIVMHIIILLFSCEGNQSFNYNYNTIIKI